MGYAKAVISFFKYLVAPKAKNKDIARQEYILNILLLSAVILSFVLTASSWITRQLAIGQSPADLSPGVVFFVFLFFLFCYVLSRRGLIRLVTYILLGIYFTGATYTAYRWGASVPQGLLLYALIIVMAGVLVNSRFSLALAVVCGLTLFVLTYLQQIHAIPISTSWMKELPHLGDALVYSLTLLVIAVVAWLSNREMEKALRRARNSEKALRQERDNLEITVSERTKALRIVQSEKMAQLERFAEFGRISSGLFHDLAAPLNLVSLNIDQLKRTDRGNNKAHLERSNTFITRSLIGIRRLESFVNAARRQVQHQEIKEAFSLHEEIDQVIQILTYKAKEKQVAIHLSFEKDIHTYGNPIKLNQVVTNILANAIDSYESLRKSHTKREIRMSVKQRNKQAEILIQDFGSGIKREDLAMIFEPFFTTKKSQKGMGIGLSICKDVIEKDFKGTIAVTSKINEGTTFAIAFPIAKKPRKKI